MKYIKWIIIFALCMIFGILFGAYLTFRFLASDIYDTFWYIILEVCILSFTFLFFGSTLFLQKKCNKHNWDTKSYIRIALFVIATVSLIYILKDEPLIESKYSWNDVPTASPTSAESYNLIYTHFTEGDKEIKIDLGNKDIYNGFEDPLSYEKQILTAWNKNKKARKLVKNLNSFDEIADLSTEENAVDYNSIKFVYLARLYGLYSNLMAEKGQSIVSARTLSEYHSVIRKALPYSRFTIHKVIFASSANRNIESAYKIARLPSCHKASLRILLENFKPLTNQEISYRGAFISEYFFITYPFHEEIFYDHLFCPLLEDSCIPKWNQYILKLIWPLIYRENVTLNFRTKEFELMIEDASKHPPNFSKTKAFVSTHEDKPNFRNSGGWFLQNSSLFVLTDFPEKMSKIKIKSDILALYLHKRLGKKIALKDYYTGKDYHQIDKSPYYISLGPDGKLGTDDDISLIDERPCK